MNKKAQREWDIRKVIPFLIIVALVTLIPIVFILSLDSDGDGIKDLNELLMGTSMFNVDTDGDGFSDSIEFEQSTSPNDAGSIPFDWAVETASWEEPGITRDWIYTCYGKYGNGTQTRRSTPIDDISMFPEVQMSLMQVQYSLYLSEIFYFEEGKTSSILYQDENCLNCIYFYTREYSGIYNPPNCFYELPLFLGKNWTYTGNVTRTWEGKTEVLDYQIDSEVIDFADITVSSGTYRVFVIDRFLNRTELTGEYFTRKYRFYITDNLFLIKEEVVEEGTAVHTCELMEA